MTISERRTIIGIPMQREDMHPFEQFEATAQDFYGEFAAHLRAHGIVTVESDDAISIKGAGQFASKHYYHHEQVNNLKIQRETDNNNPFIKQTIVWSRGDQ